MVRAKEQKASLYAVSYSLMLLLFGHLKERKLSWPRWE